MKSQHYRILASLLIPAILLWLAIIIFAALVSESGHRALADLASAASRMKSVIFVGGIVSLVLAFVCVCTLRILSACGAPIARKKIQFELAGALVGGAVSFSLAALFNGPGAAAGHAAFFLPAGMLCGFAAAAFGWRPQNA